MWNVVQSRILLCRPRDRPTVIKVSCILYASMLFHPLSSLVPGLMSSWSYYVMPWQHSHTLKIRFLWAHVARLIGFHSSWTISVKIIGKILIRYSILLVNPIRSKHLGEWQWINEKQPDREDDKRVHSIINVHIVDCLCVCCCCLVFFFLWRASLLCYK